jgi:hypothetical protein
MAHKNRILAGISRLGDDSAVMSSDRKTVPDDDLMKVKHDAND